MIFPKKILFRVHALKRMFERGITTTDIKTVLENPLVIKEYIDDKPYPSYLILGRQEQRPIHIVVAINQSTQETIIITAYIPTIEEWNDGFITKRKNT